MYGKFNAKFQLFFFASFPCKETLMRFRLKHKWMLERSFRFIWHVLMVRLQLWTDNIQQEGNLDWSFSKLFRLTQLLNVEKIHWTRKIFIRKVQVLNFSITTKEKSFFLFFCSSNSFYMFSFRFAKKKNFLENIVNQISINTNTKNIVSV